jgi:1,4-dihydroxy-2-naphthoyl-CoA hydrolase
MHPSSPITIIDGVTGAADPHPDPNLTELIRSRMPFAAMLGLETIIATAEQVVLRGGWEPEVCTDSGMMHGGYIMALADSAGAVCAALNMPALARTLTIESKTNFLRAVRSGPVIATAAPLHIGSNMIVVQTDIARSDGRLISRTLQTQAIVPVRERHTAQEAE